MLLSGLGLDQDPNTPLPPGTLIGSYRLMGLIGEGGMGRVYVGEHIKLGRRVAIKMLRAELATSPVTVARFFAEARAVNQISHENIVEITDFVEEPGGDNCIIMELLRGEDLGQRLARKKSLALSRALDITGQIANALAAVHAADIVHRDLKPDNVFLIERGGNADFVKLLDFGVAKLSDPLGRGGLTMHSTAAGQIIGTPEYMSPEQAGGQAVDHRTDIYSLGVVFYEMLTGRLPFQAKSFGELLMKHMTASVELPGREPGLPPGVQTGRDKLILDLLAKDPNDRPHSMEDVVERVQDVSEAMDLPSVPKKRASTSGSHSALGDKRPATTSTPPLGKPISVDRPRAASPDLPLAPQARTMSSDRPRTNSDNVPRRTPAAGVSPVVARAPTPQPAEPVVARVKLSTQTRAGATEQLAETRSDTKPIPKQHPTPPPGGSDKPLADRLARASSNPPEKRLAKSSAESVPLTRATKDRLAKLSAPLQPRTRSSERNIPITPPSITPPEISDRVVSDLLQEAEVVVSLRPTRRHVTEPSITAAPPSGTVAQPAVSRRTLILGGAVVIAIGITIALIAAIMSHGGTPVPVVNPPEPAIVEPPRPSEVRIKFVSAPLGATVRIAGTNEALGVTPFSKSFPRGNLSLAFQFEKAGFTTVSETITLEHDDALAASLVAEPVGEPVAVRPEPVAEPVAVRPEPAVGKPPVKPAIKTDTPAAKPLDRNGTMDVFGPKR